MGNSCTPAPTNKREYISEIGKILVTDHGKKKYYKPEEVKKAHRKSSWFNVLDFSCWAMCTFSSHSDFDEYHQRAGEVCDFIDMKTEMLQGLSVAPTAAWTEIPDINIDASWLDFGDIFDGLLEGIGELIGGILEGISS